MKYVDHVDAGDPVEVAKRYDEQEADEITFLDITASHEERNILLDVVARTVRACSCHSAWAAASGRCRISAIS